MPRRTGGGASAENYPRVVAVLNVNAKQNDRQFSETDLKILSIVANHAAAALEMVKQHPIVGYEVLLPVRILTKEHLQLVRSHHERIDGTGYPDGLQGDQIPLVVRVLTVADSYDAMSSRRPYRPPLSSATIIEQLQRYSGSQFDPDVANIFINLIEEGEVPPYENAILSQGSEITHQRLGNLAPPIPAAVHHTRGKNRIDHVAPIEILDQVRFRIR